MFGIPPAFSPEAAMPCHKIRAQSFDDPTRTDDIDRHVPGDLPGLGEDR